MADKSISELSQVTDYHQLASNDLWVLQHNNQAMSISGQVMTTWLTNLADGHGGISKIEKTGTSGVDPVIDTYTITYADATTTEFTVTNGLKGDKGDTGNGIANIVLNDDYTLTVTYTDGSTWKSGNIRGQQGEKGDKGDQGVAGEILSATASVDSNIGTPSVTINLGGTTSQRTMQFQFRNIKGQKGDTGDASTCTTQTRYVLSDTAEIPTTGWSTIRPTPQSGKYYWTRTHYNWNDGQTAYYEYTVGYIGRDGTGSGTVTSVNGVLPVNGDVTLTPSNLGAISDPETKLDGQVLAWDSNNEKWIASTMSLDGVVKSVNNVSPDASGNVNVPKATTSKLGTVMVDGVTTTTNNDGVISTTDSVVANPYENTKEYLTGEYCIDTDHKLYKRTGTSGSGVKPSTDTSHTYWNPLVVSDELTQLNNDLTAMSEYSTSEVLIGKWIDGKNLYRKVITGTIQQINQWNFVPLGFTPSYVHIVKGSVVYNSTQFVPINYIRSGTTNAFTAIIHTSNFQIITNVSEFLNSPFYAVIEYTK